jgi:sulfonate transport system substrate-binding protein
MDQTVHRRRFLKTSAALAAGLPLLSACGKDEGIARKVSAETELPKVIRLAPHGAWGSKKANGLMGMLQTLGYLEEEFSKDGVEIVWQPMDGGGIGINEAIANGLVDASSFGVFPQIIGRARGIRTRILASQGYNYAYLAVRSGHPAKTVEELRGASIAVGLGAYTHQTTVQLLKEHGLDIQDVKLVNLDSKEAAAALSTGKIDAQLGGPTLFALEDQGVVRIIYATKGRETHASAFGGLFVTEDFQQRYPVTTQRLLKSYVRAAHWAAQPENREAYFQNVVNSSTTPLKYLERDYEGRDLKEALNPVIDDYFESRLREVAVFCTENKIVREPVEVDSWLDRKTNDAVLAELGLSNFWQRWDPQGKQIVAAAAADIHV